VNYPNPSYFLILGNVDRFWLDVVKSYGFSTQEISLNDFISLKNRYSVYDPSLPDSRNVCMYYCSLNDCICIHPNDEGFFVSRGYVKDKDFRGMFSNKVSAYRWALTNLGIANKKYLAVVTPSNQYFNQNSKRQDGGLDYPTSVKAFFVSLDLTNDVESNLMNEIVSYLDDFAVISGWYGDQEYNYVRFMSERNKIVCVMHHHYYPIGLNNVSILQSLKVTIPWISKVTGYGDVALFLTDGDNTAFIYNYHDYITQVSDAVMVTLQPLLYHLAPVILRYYLERVYPISALPLGYVYPIYIPRYRDYYRLVNEYLDVLKWDVVQVLYGEEFNLINSLVIHGYDTGMGKAYGNVLEPICRWSYGVGCTSSITIDCIKSNTNVLVAVVPWFEYWDDFINVYNYVKNSNRVGYVKSILYKPKPTEYVPLVNTVLGVASALASASVSVYLIRKMIDMVRRWR